MNRPTLSSVVTLQRTLMHNARPPRLPIPKSPFVPTPPRSSPGTSTPNPQNQVSQDRSVELEGGLTFHHSPPPTAPSYTTGVVPPLLRWVAGQEVSLTGEEGAKRRRESKVGETAPSWSEEVVQQMQEMRKLGRSRKQIGDALDIPAEQRYLIARKAPQTAKWANSKAKQLEQRKTGWKPRKALAREIRERRKTFW